MAMGLSFGSIRTRLVLLVALAAFAVAVGSGFFQYFSGQRLLQQQMVQTAMAGVSGATMEMDRGQRQAVMAALGAGVQYGLVLPYGRDHESEADEIGLIYLIRAGYRPEAAIEFWQRMEQASQGQPPEWASTHPSHGTRIARLQQLVNEYRTNGTVAGRAVNAAQETK